MGTSVSSAAMARTRTFAAAAAAFMLALGLAPMAAFGSESVAGGFTPPEYEGDARSASADSATEGLTLASTLTSSGASVVSADVALDADEPVVASFTADGFTYTFGAEGVTLAAVDASAIGEDGSVTVPASVTLDGIDYDVTAVGPYAFYLSGATDVALPASIVSVDDRAFRSSDVARVIVDQANPNLASFDGCLYDSQLLSLLLIPEGRTGSVPIPSEAEVVEPSVFSHCSLVDAISVDGGGAAFLSWEGLLYSADGTTLLRVPAGAIDITIRDGCTAIAAGAMEGCAKLERINAPASVTSISPDVFESVPTVSLPAQAAMQVDSVAGSLAESGYEGDARSASADSNTGESEAELSCSAGAQLTFMVALSAVDDCVLAASPSNIEVVLRDRVDAAAWEKAGFMVSGGSSHAQTLPLALGTKGSRESLGVSSITVDPAGGKMSWRKYVNNDDRKADRPSAMEEGIDEAWVGSYASICGFSDNGDADISGRNDLALILSEEGWNGEIIDFETPERCGYTFIGWKREGGTLQYVQEGDYHLSGSVALTAQWSKNAVSMVTLRMNAGNTTTDYGKVYLWYGKGWYDTASPTDATAALPTIGEPARAGYSFRGFSPDPSAAKAEYWAGGGDDFPSANDTRLGTSDAPKTTVLYAVWEGNEVTLTWDSHNGEEVATTTQIYSTTAKVVLPAEPEWKGCTFAGWYTAQTGGEQVTADTPLPTDATTYYAQWTPVVSADVPIEVTARVDLLGLEEQTEASGYIESRSGGSLEVVEVDFEPLAGAAQLFEGHVADVFLEALAEGSTAASLRFALDAAVTEADASKLIAFALPDGYGTRVGIGYRFAIPDEVLAAIDQSRFEQVTTPVAQVVYTVALAR